MLVFFEDNFHLKWNFKTLDKKPAFFARKFDPTVSLQIINSIEQRINGIYSSGENNLLHQTRIEC